MVNPGNIRWLNPPSAQRLQVYSPPPGYTLRVIVAGPGRGLWMHATPAGRVPCTCSTDHIGLCQSDEAQLVVYLPVVGFDGRRLVLELPGPVLQQEPGLLHPEITGLWLKVKRPGPKRRGPVQVEILRSVHRAIHVVPFDPLPRLLEVWEARLWGQPDSDDQAASSGCREGGPQG